MKKFFVLTLMCLGFTALMAQNNNQFEQRARNKAEAAARECLRQGGLQVNLQLNSHAEVNMICDYMTPNPQYFGYRVDVWAVPNCPPNQPCIQVIYPVATVYVSCNGDVYDVQCLTPTPL